MTSNSIQNKTNEWRDNMIGKLKWEDVYLLWNNESYNFPKILSDPMNCQTVFVEYDGTVISTDLTGFKIIQHRQGKN